MAKYLCYAIVLVQLSFIFFCSASAMKVFGFDDKQLDDLLEKHPKCQNISRSIGQSWFIEHLGNVQFKVIDRMNTSDNDDPKTCCVKREYLVGLKSYLDNADCAEVKKEMAKPLADMEKHMHESMICAPEHLKCDENGMPQLNATEKQRWDCTEKIDDAQKSCMNQMQVQMKELPMKVLVQFKDNVFTSSDACCLYWDFIGCFHKIADEPSCVPIKANLVSGFEMERKQDRVKVCDPEKFHCKAVKP